MGKGSGALVAALVSIVVVMAGARACRRQNRLAFARTTKESRAPGASPTRFVYPTFVPRPTPTPLDPAVVFRRQVEAAAPGTWVTAQDIGPVLAPGPLGSWDDFKVGSPVVLEEQGTYRLWYRGCHFHATEYSCGVGHATSKGGITWDKASAPVFVPPDPFEREHLDAIAVVHGAGEYLLWYSVRTTSAPGRRRASLHVARSADGLAWTEQAGPIYEAVAQSVRLVPVAVFREERFHLWVIDSRSAIDPSTGLFPEMPADGDDVILHFVSADGARLEAVGSTPLQPLRMDWVPFSISAEPSGGFRALFYERQPSGVDKQGVAVLRSADGSRWERATDEAMPLGVSDLASRGVPLSLVALAAPHGLLAWFVVRDDRGGEAIRVAFRKEAT